MNYTTQKQVRDAFWQAHPNLPKRRIKDHRGDGLMYCVDTRCAFVEFVDCLHRDGQISTALADRVTL